MGLAKDGGMLAQFKLTITQAPGIDLTGATLSAKGTASATAPTQSQLSALPPLAPVPVLLTSGASDSATVSLLLQPAAAQGEKVAFNHFVVASAKSLDGPSWSIKGEVGGTAGVLATAVALNGDAAATNPTELIFPFDAAAAAQVRADFSASIGVSARVTLLASDKYGQQASIVVTLNSSPLVSGTFNIALASKVAAVGATAQMVASGATGNQVDALAMGTTTVNSGWTSDSSLWSDIALEAWLDCSTYFNPDGSVKTKTMGSNDYYAVWWDAKLPAGTTSKKSSAPAQDSVAMTASLTGAAKAGRKKLQVGNLLNTVEVVLRIYQPSTALAAMGLTQDLGLLSEFSLTINTAPIINLTATVLRAKGRASATAPTLAQLAASAQVTGTVTLATRPYRAIVTLSFDSSYAAGSAVAYNAFEVLPGLAWEGASWTIKGEASPSAAIAQTYVELRSDDNPATSAAEIALPLTNSDQVRADFSGSSTSNGQVTITITDKYGQKGYIVVTLDDRI